MQTQQLSGFRVKQVCILDQGNAQRQKGSFYSTIVATINCTVSTDDGSQWAGGTLWVVATSSLPSVETTSSINALNEMDAYMKTSSMQNICRVSQFMITAQCPSQGWSNKASPCIQLD